MRTLLLTFMIFSSHLAYGASSVEAFDFSMQSFRDQEAVVDAGSLLRAELVNCEADLNLYAGQPDALRISMRSCVIRTSAAQDQLGAALEQSREPKASEMLARSVGRLLTSLYNDFQNSLQ